MQQGDVGRERRNEPDALPNGDSTTANPGFCSIDEPTKEPGDDGGKPACRGLEALDEGEDRPVLDLDRARAVRLLEHGVRACRSGSCRPSKR